MKRERATGVHAVDALVRRVPDRVIRVWIKSGSERLDHLADLARDAGIAVEHADEAGLNRLAGDAPHQGVVAEFRPRLPVTENELHDAVEAAGRDALVLVLDGVQDPHNLGACLRSAAAFSATAVVVPKNRAAGLTPAARRAAAGAAETVPLAVVTNLSRTLDRLARAQVWRVGLEGAAETPLQAVNLDGPLVLVMGGEERGMRRLTREHCDILARIAMPGDIESLNVSVSTGIALFETHRQRGNR